ncbi:hypothetical protein [Sphingomonas sp.]|uniref:hypothetical protein n=1 Tax=Sphingomonas sp. TaxID=28214 RepID=UPI001B1F0422|nr:hypothetical protein [Sphingomonas sp.]MBO9711677.1 hypothetical protein [Sphingomonas sp.]
MIARALEKRPRREWLVAAHHPWGPAAAYVDAWALLDLCHAPAILDAVAALIGPDLILWDSELLLDGGPEDDPALWPVEPLAGALALVRLDGSILACARLGEPLPACGGPALLIRYLPAASRFVRDPGHPAHIAQMEAEPLVDRTRRPLWLVRGRDRAANDFVTGFALAAPCWAAA